jgi:HKD family nuclease
MLQLIANTSHRNHAANILGLLSKAEEVSIMVAFLKTSGLKQISPYLDGIASCKILAGASYGLTEPDALTTLLKRSNTHPRHYAYLTRLDSRQVFHPKMYLFRTGNLGHIIIGSANMTNGGLVTNNECSLYYQCIISDPVWHDAVAYFDQAIQEANADPLSERIIALYRGYYERQRKIYKKSKPSPTMDGNIFYNLDRLRGFLQNLDQAKIRADLAIKEEKYRQAATILQSIESQEHSSAEFQVMLESLAGKAGAGRIWYSNGLFRKKTTIFNEQGKFRALLSAVKNNLHQPPEIIYEQAKMIAKGITGLGPGWLGEIMMTLAPTKLANINQNPITALREWGGVSIKAAPISYSGADYAEYNAIVQDVAAALGLPNMLAADYFFNEIFQQIKEERAATNVTANSQS